MPQIKNPLDEEALKTFFQVEIAFIIAHLAIEVKILIWQRKKYRLCCTVSLNYN